MKKQIDASFLRKAAKGILEHLGEEEEGENPDISPNSKMADIGDGGQDELYKTAPSDSETSVDMSDSGVKFQAGTKKTKRSDSALALLASNLASKFNK